MRADDLAPTARGVPRDTAEAIARRNHLLWRTKTVFRLRYSWPDRSQTRNDIRSLPA